MSDYSRLLHLRLKKFSRSDFLDVLLWYIKITRAVYNLPLLRQSLKSYGFYKKCINYGGWDKNPLKIKNMTANQVNIL